MSAGIELKLVPVMVTGVPDSPDDRLRLVIAGMPAITIKLSSEVTFPFDVCTEIVLVVPGVVLPGIVTVSDVDVTAATDRGSEPQLTVLLASILLKLVPVIFTVVPGVPELGLILVTVGALLVPDEAASPPPLHAVKINIVAMENALNKLLKLVFMFNLRRYIFILIPF